MSTRKTAPAKRAGTAGTARSALTVKVAKAAASKTLGRPVPAVKAVVCLPGEAETQLLGAQPAGRGRVYQVLAPTAQPRHLSSDDIETLLRQMVASK